MIYIDQSIRNLLWISNIINNEFSKHFGRVSGRFWSTLSGLGSMNNLYIASLNFQHSLLTIYYVLSVLNIFKPNISTEKTGLVFFMCSIFYIAGTLIGGPICDKKVSSYNYICDKHNKHTTSF